MLQHERPDGSCHCYGGTVVQIMQAGWVQTILPDGEAVNAVPQDTAEDRARAKALGYGDDLWAMTRDHDRFHALICHAVGLKESPALRASLKGHESELTGAEECAVLALQRFVNECRKAGLMR